MGYHTTWQPTIAIPLIPLLSSQRRSVPIPDVIFPSFSLSASPSPSSYSALEDRSSCDMPIPLHFASFHGGQEFFIGSNVFPNPASHLFIGDVVFVRDAKETSETSHSTVYIFLFISAVNVQVSQEYKNMDMTKERNCLIFELRSMFLSSQMILSFVSAAMDWAILECISGMYPLSVTIAPKHLKF